MAERINTRNKTLEKVHVFSVNPDSYKSPEKFTFPFNYSPHPLAKLAAEELQAHLGSQDEWTHNFGFYRRVDGKATGKMFGVLVVENDKGDLGHLWAFSGKLAGRNDHPEFVPPIYNMLEEDGFFRTGERELNAINKEVDDLINSKEYQSLKDRYYQFSQQSESELDSLKQKLRQKKNTRDSIRSKTHDESTLKELEDESKSDHFFLKDSKKKLKHQLDQSRGDLTKMENRIKELKDSRRTKSAKLQKQLFEAYNLLSASGTKMNLPLVFDERGLPIPSGAGECAAPKLLQYAYTNQLKPIALAEFWWGNPPNMEVRKHGHYYPSCKRKCEPILSFMLQGLHVDDNPMLLDHEKYELDVLHEDDEIIIINKPSGLLSVPGKTNRKNVMDLALERFRDLSGPVIVHRLDMATSGIMILAKNELSYRHIQEQFARRVVKKRYVAILRGKLDEESGTINLPLRVDLDNRPQQLVCFEHGKKAFTRWEKIREIHGNSVVYFYPETGRTHQLRMHAAHHLGLNAPIIGDELYGNPDKRLLLHAESIEFTHPKTDEQVLFRLPPEFI